MSAKYSKHRKYIKIFLCIFNYNTSQGGQILMKFARWVKVFVDFKYLNSFQNQEVRLTTFRGFIIFMQYQLSKKSMYFYDDNCI